MIKRLRIKFVCINMALVTVVLAALMVLFIQQTHLELQNRALEGMKQAALEPGRPGRPGQNHFTPTFTMYYDEDGTLIVTGGEFFDLSDTAALEQIYLYAQKDGREFGVLSRYNLRYYRDHGPFGVRYVFADYSSERAALENLIGRTLLLGAGGFLVFLAISVALAFWAVGPVEQAWKQQRQFVADASHELKTPLTVILTNAELLQSGDYEEQDQQRFTDSILIMARQMRSLVENLLDLARVDNGQMNLVQSRLNFSALVEEAVLPFEPVYFEQGLCLESQVEPGLFVMGSSQHLRQVVEILLDNGCKYGTPGGTVELRLVKQNRGKVLLTVSSPGEALTQQQCQDIFKRFYRVDESRTGHGSYGLGLPIAQQILQQHRGKIWAQGKDGKNIFFVQLPEG